MKCKICEKEKTIEEYNSDGFITTKNTCDCDKPISTRNYFAGQAIPGLMDTYGTDFDDLAEHAFNIADAMMKARNKEN